MPGGREPAGTSGVRDVVLVHDYLTQRGGAERVVLSMLRAFPGATVHTSVFHPPTTFPEFEHVDVRTTALQRLPVLQRNHRLAFPVLAAAFGHLRVDAPVVVCSSSGWAHGVKTTGQKIVYCHTPARWLYQGDRYLGEDSGAAERLALHKLRPHLQRWDRAAARCSDRYLANSTAVRDRIRELYDIDAAVLSPPHAADPDGPARPVPRIEPGFVLCVGRLLPYKNVRAIIGAFRELRHERLVVVGTGPSAPVLHAAAADMANVTFLGSVDDEELRWLYAASTGLVTASHEDFGLTPLEAAAFGRPTAALRFGGFLDTIRDGVTGVLYDQPQPGAIADAVRQLVDQPWDDVVLRAHAETYSETRFVEQLCAFIALASGAVSVTGPPKAPVPPISLVEPPVAEPVPVSNQPPCPASAGPGPIRSRSVRL